MELLNDDCILLICKLLPLKDQIVFAKASRHAENILAFHWQKKYVKLHFNFALNYLTFEEFGILISKICDTVIEMKLKDLTEESFQVLRLYEYPQLVSFSFSQLPRFNLNDDHILEMTKLFPNLSYFSPHGAFTGKHMANWSHLKDLKLSYCRKIEFYRLEEILENVQLIAIELDIFDTAHQWSSQRAFENFCKLKRFYINTTELVWLEYMSKYTNLSKLTITDRADAKNLTLLFDNLCEYKQSDIVQLETSLPLYFQQAIFANLQKVILLALNLGDHTSILKCAPTLREFIFIQGRIMEASEIVDLLSISDQIEYISIENSNCTFETFELNAWEISTQLVNNLTFNFYENLYLPLAPTEILGVSLDAIEVNIIVNGNIPNLKVTTDGSTTASFEPLEILFR